MRVPGRLLIAITTLGALAGLSGCDTPAAAGVWDNPGSSASARAGARPGTTATITGPADAATGVSTAAEITFTTNHAASTGVALTDSTGAVVEGNMRPDGSAWVPATQLRYATTYTATVTATGDGAPDTRKATFTTMSRPGKRVRVSTPLDDDGVYGVALPIVVILDEDVPTDKRAEVERRLFVTSEPAQDGGWNWFSGHEIHYRPRDYWLAGTKLLVRLGVGGLLLGDNTYGAEDVTIRASIGEKIVMSTDNATHTMTVTRGDQVARNIPVSLGRPSKPSSSGAMVVMGKAEHDVFVSTEPGDSYRADVNWTQRLTWGGEYLHAAPWSVDDQGRRNVSHGCTNMSDDNARWLFGITHIGDPVIVKGTEVHLEWGNGWTDWDRGWDGYRKGSALPQPPTPR